MHRDTVRARGRTSCVGGRSTNARAAGCCAWAASGAPATKKCTITSEARDLLITDTGQQTRRYSALFSHAFSPPQHLFPPFFLIRFKCNIYNLVEPGLSAALKSRLSRTRCHSARQARFSRRRISPRKTVWSLAGRTGVVASRHLDSRKR